MTVDLTDIPLVSRCKTPTPTRLTHSVFVSVSQVLANPYAALAYGSASDDEDDEDEEPVWDRVRARATVSIRVTLRLTVSSAWDLGLLGLGL